MFDNVVCYLNAVLDSCDNMCCDNIVEKLSEIRTAVAAAKLEIEEIEFQQSNAD